MEFLDDTLKASRYVIYARKSTDDPQKQVRSIEDQVRECEHLANRLNLNVVGQPIVEEISAKRPDRRPGFNRLIKMIQKEEVDGIIAWHPDRLARNMSEGGDLIQLVDDGKLIDMRFVSFHFTNDANGKMMLGIQFAMSKHYSDKLSTDIRRGIMSNLQEGKSAGHYKAGYKRSKTTGFYYPDETNFDPVKKAWEMKLDGEKETDIVKKVNALGYRRRLIKKQPRQKPVQYMDKSKLNKMFQDSFYYGLLSQADEEIDLTALYEFEPVVTKEEFDRVQRMKKNYQKEEVKHDFPFRGFVVCAKCGRFRIASPSKGKSSRYLYMRCDTKGCPEKGKSIRSLEIINTIYSVLKDGFDFENVDKDTLNKALKALMKASNKEVNLEYSTLTGHLTTKKGRLESLVGNYLEHGSSYDKAEKQAYDEKKGVLETQIKQLKQRLNELKGMKKVDSGTVEKTLNTLKRASDSFKTSDNRIKDRIAKTVFLNTYVEGKKVLYLKAKEPFDKLLNHPLVSNGGARGT